VNDIIIETERLYLRKFVTDDAEWLSKIYADIDVMRYIATGVVIPYEYVKKGIERRISNYSEWKYIEGVIIDKSDDKPIGHCGFGLLHDKSDVELAYLLDKPYWGKGFATEIASAMLSYGFDKLEYKKIVGMVYPQNISSANVLKKIGMKYDKEVEFWNIIFDLYSVESATLKH
jgi:[ribosomal protein S5]-alanine N-acetyltransferase